MRRRFWLEAGLTLATGVLAVVTLISRDWIEVVFHVEPDGGSGLLEWVIVIVLAAVTLASGVVTRAEWQRAASSPSTSD